MSVARRNWRSRDTRGAPAPRMPIVAFAASARIYPARPGPAGHRPRLSDRSAHDAAGPERVRQDDLAEDHRGSDPGDSGEVSVNGKPVTGPGPERAFVFQDFALMPWANVERNVAFGLELRGAPAREREETAAPLHRAGRACRLRGALSARALGRHAPARRARPGARGRRRRASHRRTVLGRRRANPPQVSGGSAPAAGARAQDLHFRDAQHRGGGLSLRPIAMLSPRPGRVFADHRTKVDRAAATPTRSGATRATSIRSRRSGKCCANSWTEALPCRSADTRSR